MKNQKHCLSANNSTSQTSSTHLTSESNPDKVPFYVAEEVAREVARFINEKKLVPYSMLVEKNEIIERLNREIGRLNREIGRLTTQLEMQTGTKEAIHG